MERDHNYFSHLTLQHLVCGDRWNCKMERMKHVAVSVRHGGGRGSLRAVRWAVKFLLPISDRFTLIHVMPKITSIPTPSGTHIPIGHLDKKLVTIYVHDMRVKCGEIFTSFKKLCKKAKVETLILEDDNTADALLRYISDSNISCLVMGSEGIFRKLKGPGLTLPSMVLRNAPDTCDIYVISRFKVSTKWANPLIINESIPRSKQMHVFESSSSLLESNDYMTLQTSLLSDFNTRNCQTFSSARIDQEMNNNSVENSNLDTYTVKPCSFMVSSNSKKSDAKTEIEQLRLKLQNNVAMYEQARKVLIHVQHKVQLLSSECRGIAKKVNEVMETEETLRKIASQEKEKYINAIREVDLAKKLLAEETYGRRMAELSVLNESAETRKICDELFSNDMRYRKYSRDEMMVATQSFSENHVIGEGGYGKVYRCNIDHTPVAIKVLRPDASDRRREEFLREVEILSELRHPHVVLLLGACSELGCLVYEYMENGSLEDHIFRLNGRPSLTWLVRFRIAFEIACGIAFLHAAKPEPIVHRDLKPGNILLDRNYVSKIGDVGLAKLISDVIPDDVTAYGETMLAGTLHYMDPEYQRTGALRPKSDLFSLGVIILQLLAGLRPNGLILMVENAVATGFLSEVLDKSVKDWPLVETEELARIALKCCMLRCRDRPSLETEVLPILKRLVDMSKASMKSEREDTYAPNPYFCPILQEIMDDPHIAADGFSYEHRAIKEWFKKHNVSPVTKHRLEHIILTPNHTLRSAIHEWRSHITFSSS